MQAFLNRNRYLILFVLVIVFIEGCYALFSGNSYCSFPSSFEKAPSWVCGEIYPGLEIQAVGSAHPSKAGEAFTRTMAEVDARSQLIKKLHDKFSQPDASTKDSEKIIKEETLLNAKIYQYARGPDKTLYVLLGLKTDAVEAIGKSLLKQQND